MALTAKQLQVLRLIADGKMKGEQAGYGWRFTDGLVTYTAAVMALSAKAYVEVTYYRGYAASDLSNRGRALLREAA